MWVCREAEEWLTLSFLPGFGCSRIFQLVETLGSPKEVLRLGNDATKLCPGFGERLAALLSDAFALAAARKRAARELILLEQQQVSLLSYQCPCYPSSLHKIDDKPVLLYLRGDEQVLQSPMLAIVGARSASTYGKRVSYEFASALAGCGITIVSGAAYGVDAAAHLGALSVPGATIAVLGCGVDVPYPASHKQLLDKIAEQGIVLSEYPMGTRPESFRFPVRNRIISGLSQAVLVVEATEKSGSLITARLSLDQGREVMAVPGRIDSAKSKGTHALIRQGATLVQDVGEVLESLSWGRDVTPSVNENAASVKRVPPNCLEEAVLAALECYPIDIDTLARESKYSLTELQSILLEPELQGRVRQLPGRLYEKIV